MNDAKRPPLRLAVVLMNAGGPDGPSAVQPFLFNLFNDKAIVGLPQPLRWLAAKLFSWRRATVAREIYRHLGGGSPILAETQAQAKALAETLAKAMAGDFEVATFVAMRYWHPFARETVKEVAAFAPDLMVQLPLYPQYSTTTSGSSLAAWNSAAKAAGIDCPVRTVCCYPTAEFFIRAHAGLIETAMDKLGNAGAQTRLLFSAHGLPQKIIDGGDPYQWQVEQTARAVIQELERRGRGVAHWTVCYQSRVGPLKWLRPTTPEEISRAGRDGKGVVVVPIAFVSEHAETLVELDIEYAHLARKVGARPYIRVPALGTAALFVEALAELVRGQAGGDADIGDLDRGPPICSQLGGRICPSAHNRCPIGTATSRRE